MFQASEIDFGPVKLIKFLQRENTAIGKANIWARTEI